MHKQHTRLMQSQPGKVLGVTQRDQDKMPGSVDMRLKWPVALLRHQEMAHSVAAVQPATGASVTKAPWQYSRETHPGDAT